jgi:hypothetical protein
LFPPTSIFTCPQPELVSRSVPSVRRTTGDHSNLTPQVAGGAWQMAQGAAASRMRRHLSLYEQNDGPECSGGIGNEHIIHFRGQGKPSFPDRLRSLAMLLTKIVGLEA